MPLTDFEVVTRQEHIDDCVVISANDGKQRVLGFVPREPLDDYAAQHFGRPSLSYGQRVFLVQSENNLNAFTARMAEKYAAGEVSLYRSAGSTLPRIDFTHEDLNRMAPLEGTPLDVYDHAGFQAVR